MRKFYFITTVLLACVKLFAQGSETVAPHVPGRLIVRHVTGVRDVRAARAFAQHGATVHAQLGALNASVIDVTPGTEDAVLASLRGNALFSAVEYDYYAQPAAAPNDPLYASQWHLQKIQAAAAWNITTGASFPIAVVDTGVDHTHPDLGSRVIAGWNFLTGNSNTMDALGHGTAVAGVIGAAANNGVGVAGITWRNPIMPLVVVDSNNYAAYSNIAAAIQYAADHGARVINVSLGGTQSSWTLQNAVDYAWGKGAVVVAAAMNNGNSTPEYPAACNNAIAVSATDENDSLASFSDYGSWITVSAPGNNIMTTQKGGSYGYWWGTSLAAPVVSSVAALALAANPGLTPQKLVTLIENNADDLGAHGHDVYFGWGRVNAHRTAQAAAGQPTPPSAPPTPPPPPTPPSPPAPPASSTFFVNAGGAAYKDPAGTAWSADTGYSGGEAWSVSLPILNTNTPALYQSCRYGDFTYNFSVPDGAYNMTLKFAEVSRFAPGERQFNVAINGARELTNFDIFAQAGGAYIALDRTFPVTVTNGQIAIQFTSGAVDLPLVSAIEIGPVSQTASAHATVQLNAGGGSYTDSSGAVWSADKNYSGGANWSVTNAISNTTAAALYQSCRYGNFTYTFNLPNGSYNVVLKFAEVSRFASGERMFNVAINGARELTNFDIFAQAGGAFVALDKTFSVTVTNGQIAIQFSSGAADLPLVSAIEIR